MEVEHTFTSSDREDAPLPPAQCDARRIESNAAMEEGEMDAAIHAVINTPGEAPMTAAQISAVYDAWEAKAGKKPGPEAIESDDAPPPAQGDAWWHEDDAGKKPPLALAKVGRRRQSAHVALAVSNEGGHGQSLPNNTGRRPASGDGASPPPPSTTRSPSDPSSVGVPILHARLVEDDPTVSIVEAEPLPHAWWRRHQRFIIVALLLLIAALVAILGASLLSRGNPNDAAASASATTPGQRTDTERPTPSPTSQHVETIADASTTSPSPEPIVDQPTPQPTVEPVTDDPTRAPTSEPVTDNPTRAPTPEPVTVNPTRAPTPEPVTESPTHIPTTKPSERPTLVPSQPPTPAPSPPPTRRPTHWPTRRPSERPSRRPTRWPTSRPTEPDPSNVIWGQLGRALAGDASGDLSGSSVSLSTDGRVVAMGAPGSWANGDRPGYVRVYAYQSGTGWIQLGQTILGKENGNSLGYSINLSSDGSTLAVGAPGYWTDANQPGFAEIYRLEGTLFENDSSWRKLGQTIYGEANADQLGMSVSLSRDGSMVAVGANGNDRGGEASGLVQVFELDASNRWNQMGDAISGEAIQDNSGKSVALSADGKVLAVGASANDGNGEGSGHVRVFQFDGKRWDQIGEVDGLVAGDMVGVEGTIALSADGRTLAVGSYQRTRISPVRVFRREGDDEWRQLGQELYGDAAGSRFGRSVSLSADGNIVAIGADHGGGNGISSGQVNVYYLDTMGGEDLRWKRAGQTLVGAGPGDQAGWSVALSGDGRSVAIGSVANGDNGELAGHVRIFQY